MPKHLIYTAFSGVMTNNDYYGTTHSEFYKLQLDPNDPSKMKPEDDILQAFSSNKDLSLLMSPDTIKFFKTAVNNDDVEVNIVTDTPENYVKALLRFHKFSNDALKKIKI